MTRNRLVAGLVVCGLLGVFGWAVTDVVLGQQIEVKQAIAQPGVVIQPGGIMQPVDPGKTTGGSAASQLSSIKIIESSEHRRVINVARDCVRDKAWEEGVTLLQTLLDSKEDHYVQVRDKDAQGRETTRWTSVKFEANNLLGAMDPEGLQVYELRYGAKAKDKLDEAKKKGDRELLADVAQRYCHTKAGIEANEILATLLLARGQHFIAALRFERLLAMDPARTNLSDLTLYKAALALRRSGDTKAADAIWTKLEANLQATGGLRLSEQVIPIAKLKEVLSEEAAVETTNPYEWTMIRGNNTNTAQATGSPPLLDSVLWKRPVLLDKRGEKLIHEEHQAKARIDQAIANMRDQHKLPVLPGFFPITSKGMLVYRTHSGIRAVAIKDIKDSKGVTHKPGDMVWTSLPFRSGLANLLDQDNDKKGIIESWLSGGGGMPQPQPQPFPQPFPGNQFGMFYMNANWPGVAGALYENTTIGTLSTDGQFIYAIDDLAVAPPFGYNPFILQQNNMGKVREYVTCNELLAFTSGPAGKLAWFLGGKDEPSTSPFYESHFLGAPISIGGKIYVLNEKNPANSVAGGAQAEAELRLVCIDPSKRDPQTGKPVVVGQPQLLGMVQPQNRVAFDISRRTSATHLAFGEGILVCPTNAGEVFGVDLMNRALVWSYPYREQSHVAPFSNNNNIGGPFGGPPQKFVQPALGSSVLSNWKSTPPAVVDGKVVFTAPDANSVHCINLRDGTPVWKSGQRDGDLYMAGVFNGKVLVVGKSSIRALSLQTGATLWYLPTHDVPSGQGVASKNVYYLPLSKGEILAVDIDRGTLKAHNRAAGEAAKIAPGNLVFYEGCVVSVTPTDVVAYPQLNARLDEATAALKADPENLDKLTNHGELLLKDGQVQAAVTDLEKVVAKDPPGALGQRAKDRLHEALTDLLQVNFNEQGDKYLPLYKTLCSATSDNQEKELRLAKYYRIVGQGRESQGNLVEAFQAYKDFGALPIHNQQGGVAALDDPSHKVPTHVWLRGRVSAMIAKATPEQRAPLEAKIRDEWKDVLAKKNLDAIRSFVGMFDVPFQVGREARLHLADTIIDKNDKAAFLEAEMNLGQLLTPQYRKDGAVGGRALATLALLEEKKGTADAVKTAAAYYRELAHDFAKVEVRKGKTGEDLFNELPPKIFLPYLEERGSAWGKVKMGGRKVGNAGYAGGQRFVLAPTGDDGPFARQHRLDFEAGNPNNTQLRLVDVATGKERWTQNLGQVANNAAMNIFFNLYQGGNINIPYNAAARHRFFHIKGHLIVAQVGIMAYCIDGDSGKILWRQPLVEGLENQPNVNIQAVGADVEGNPEFVIFNPQFGMRQGKIVMGQIGAVQASYVAIVTQKGLVVNDPLRGTLLWKKMDLSPGTRVFGDEEFLFVLEGSDGGSSGAGRVMRAIDGAVLDKVPDFGPIYNHKVAVNGRHILAAMPGKKSLTLRLYDIVAGKDIWSKAFDASCMVLHTEDPRLTGVIDTKGNVTVLDATNGAEIVTGNVLRHRVGPEDVKGLHNPLLLADAERFYIALNRSVDAAKQGTIFNNFANGVRSRQVNGWVVALHRKDGEKKAAGKTQAFKKGDFAWHSMAPLSHQMVILEQFDQLPVMLFSARYNEPINGGMNGFRWQSLTQSLDKNTGKFIYDGGPENNNGAPQFYAFNIDQQIGTINMVGYNGVVQHYIDDGRKLPQTGQVGTPGSNPYGPGLNPYDLNVPPGFNPGLPPGGGIGIPVLPGGKKGGIRIMPAPIAPVPPGGLGGQGGQLILPQLRIDRNLEVIQEAVPVPPPAPPK
jgi:outer membrane protein assembly factor BamB/tetratricopeptide (TPR) repeat protein